MLRVSGGTAGNGRLTTFIPLKKNTVLSLIRVLAMPLKTG
jgi:hypothetical protein